MKYRNFDWAAKKHFLKDKSKSGRRYYSGIKRVIKKFTVHKLRGLTKQAIKNERYDQCPSVNNHFYKDNDW